MKFRVYNRQEVESGELRKLRQAHIVISVSDPGDPPPRLKTSALCREVVSLQFHDACPTPGLELPAEICLATTEDTEQIWRSVVKWKDSVSTIVVHCEAGMSRSPAIAAAIARALGQDDDRFWYEYQPNEWIYDLLLSRCPVT